MKQYILIAIILGCNIQMQAQTAVKDTSLQRVLILEREYVPTIDNASKINTLPEIREPQATQAQIEFSIFSTPANFNPEASNVETVHLESSAKRGYLKAGVSTFVDIDGDAGYQILNDATDELSIWATHRSSNGNVKSMQTDENLKMKLNDNTGALRYSHNFDSSSKLFADAKYIYSRFNYFGGGTEGENLNQINNIFDAGLGYYFKNTLPLNIFLKANFIHFDQEKSSTPDIEGIKENIFKLDFDVNKDLDINKWVGIGGYIRVNSYSIPSEVSKNYEILALNPYFKMEEDNWKMRLGAIPHILFNQSKKVFFAPDIEFSFRPLENALLYLTATGEITDNNGKNIFYGNRYISPGTKIEDSYTWLNTTAGFKITLLSVFDMDFYAGYRITEQEHFYDMSSIKLPRVLPDDFYRDYHTKVFRLGTTLKYQYSKIFDIRIKATYYHWDVDKTGTKYQILEAWHKPTFETDLAAGFRFQTIPLRADLAYHLEAGRKMHDFDVANSVFTMKSINDVSLTGTYTLDETFSFFARANNLLNQRYDIWYGYPAQGIRLMGGVSVKF